jgi:Anti-sigma-K factor rskA
VLGTVRNEVASDDNEVAPGDSLRARGPRLRSLAVLAATAAVAAVVATAVSQSPSAQRLARGAMRAPAAQTARASLRYTAGRAELVVSGMPEPPIGEVYELWLNRPGSSPRPTDALFMVTSAGSGSVEVPGSLRGVREVMVTSEPLGGSSSPTSLAVLHVRVAPGR